MNMKNKKILCISAHPDDETLGCGGTLAKLSKDNEISIVTFTDGVSARVESDSSDRRNRLKNYYKAVKILGIEKKNVFNYGVCYYDNELDKETNLSIIKHISGIKNEFQPDIVFTHFRDCLNIDHKILSYCTYVSFRSQPGDNKTTIFEYEISSSTEYSNYSFTPNVFVDISQYIDKKIQAFQSYKEEIKHYPHPRSIEMLNHKSQYWGSFVGVTNAEAFICRKLLL